MRVRHERDWERLNDRWHELMSEEQHAVRTDFTPVARRLGVVAATSLVALQLVYAATLTAGLLSLASPDEPIRDPMFSLMEVLILLMMPAMLALMGVVHAWATPSRRPHALIALVFMGALVTVTSTLHFTVLTLARQPALQELPWWPLMVEFEWPSLAYALDILAWDVFFAGSMFFAAMVFDGRGLARAVRWLMLASGALALAGTAGVLTGDMQIRNVGIVGYLGVFLVVVVLLGVLFHRTPSAAPG